MSRRRGKGIICGAVALAAMLTTGRASSAPDDSKASEKIYLDARAAFDKGDFDKACPLFQQYYDLELTPAALFTLAECEARWGKPARALAHFETFTRQSADAPPSAVQESRARLAYEQIAKLSALVGKVTPVVSSNVRGSVVVLLDGNPVAMPAQHATVVEPGEHVLTLTTEDGTKIEKKFVIATGEARRIELGAAETPPPPPPPKKEEPPQRSLTPVIIAGGVGAAGLIVGGLFGGLAMGQASTIDDHCPNRLCDAEGTRAVDRGQTFATVSTVGFVVGLTGVVAAGVLYLLSPSSPSGGERR